MRFWFVLCAVLSLSPDPADRVGLRSQSAAVTLLSQAAWPQAAPGSHSAIAKCDVLGMISMHGV
jgi:hypothetical protein